MIEYDIRAIWLFPIVFIKNGAPFEKATAIAVWIFFYRIQSDCPVMESNDAVNECLLAFELMIIDYKVFLFLCGSRPRPNLTFPCIYRH